MKFLKLISKGVHKLSEVFSNTSEKNRKSLENVIVPSSSKLNLNGLRLKNNCCVKLGEQSQVVGSLIFDKEGASINIGNRAFINGSIIAASSISIGDDVLISWNVTIVDHNSHSTSFSYRSQDAVDWLEGKKEWANVKTAPIQICNKVWIGFNAILLKGITIGEGAVIGAGSVVTKDVPPWTIVAGNPARIIREIPEHER